MVKFVMTVFLVAAMAQTTPTAVVDAMDSQTTGSGLRRKLSCNYSKCQEDMCDKYNKDDWKGEGYREAKWDIKEKLDTLVACTKPENANLDRFSGELSSIWARGQGQPLTCSQGPGKVTLQCNQHGAAYEIIDDCTRHSCDGTENVKDSDNCFCGGGENIENICTKKQCSDNRNTCPDFIKCLLPKNPKWWDPREIASREDVVKLCADKDRGSDARECVQECGELCNDRTGSTLTGCMAENGYNWASPSYSTCHKIVTLEGHYCSGRRAYKEVMDCCPETCKRCPKTTTASPIAAAGPAQSDASRTPSHRRNLNCGTSTCSKSMCERAGHKKTWKAEGYGEATLAIKETLENLVACTKPENANLDRFSGDLPSIWARGQDQPLTCSQGPGKVTLQCNQHGDAYEIIDDCTRHSCDDTGNVKDGDNCFCGDGIENICTKKQCKDNRNTCPKFITCLLGRSSTWDPRTYPSGADIKSAGMCHKNKDAQECVDECASCIDKTGTDLKQCMEKDGRNWSTEKYGTCSTITSRDEQGYTCASYGRKYPELRECCPEQPHCNKECIACSALTQDTCSSFFYQCQLDSRTNNCVDKGR